MRTLFGISLILYLLKLSAGQGLCMFRLFDFILNKRVISLDPHAISKLYTTLFMSFLILQVRLYYRTRNWYIRLNAVHDIHYFNF